MKMSVEIKTQKEKQYDKEHQTKRFSLKGFDWNKYLVQDFELSKKADDNIKYLFSVGFIVLLYGFGYFDLLNIPVVSEGIALISTYLTKKILDLVHYYLKKDAQS